MLYSQPHLLSVQFTANNIACLQNSYTINTNVYNILILEDGVFSDWIDVGNCTRECGGGTQEQIRVCDNPRPSCGGRNCIGLKTQVVQCNLQCCPGWCHKVYYDIM